MRILIDQDGVLAGFDERFFDLCLQEGVELNIKSLDDPNRKRFMTDNIVNKADIAKMRKYVDHGKHRYFRDLPIMPGAVEGVAALEAAGVDVWICTKPLEMNWRCRDDKAEWTRRHFPHLEDKLIMAPDKGLIKGDILLDDAPKLKWLEYAEWAPVVYPHSFNGPGSQWEGLPRWSWGSPVEQLLDAAKSEPHLIEFRNNGWTIQHPAHERRSGTLFDCPLSDWRGGDSGARGKFILLDEETYTDL